MAAAAGLNRAAPGGSSLLPERVQLMGAKKYSWCLHGCCGRQTGGASRERLAETTSAATRLLYPCSAWADPETSESVIDACRGAFSGAITLSPDGGQRRGLE